MAFNGERIVVLGGSSGIGLATAQAAAREGATVVIASSRKARIDEALATLPTGTEGHVLDLADGDATQALFARLGSFDHLVFTAGETLQLGSLATTDVDAARRSSFALRYWGAFYAARKIWQRQYSQGRLDRCSIFRHRGAAAARGLVARRKHLFAAMEGLTRALAVELAPIRVNIVSPGVVQTPLWANMAEADRAALVSADALTSCQSATWETRSPRSLTGVSLPHAANLQHGPSPCRGRRCGPGLGDILPTAVGRFRGNANSRKLSAQRIYEFTP